MSFTDAINAMSGNKKTDKENAEEILKDWNKAIKSISRDLDKYREWKGLPDISIEKRFTMCSGKTTKESAIINSEYDGAFVTDGVVQKAIEFATEATPERILTHHVKYDSFKL